MLIIEEKHTDPAFTGSPDEIAKEMPLELFEEAVQNDDDLNDNSEEGFEVFGDSDGDVEL